jgi:uncharacterized cofD-like protein
MTEADVLVDPVLEELENDLAEVRVAALGGGHGLAGALRAVLHFAGEVTAIVTVADDGGSSGRLSPALEIPPPGDIRMALLALSPEGTTWRDLMEYRFEESDVAGHSLGNLIIAAFANLSGSFEEALDRVGRLLGARGTVLPAAPVPLVLEADVDGKVIAGQVAIARSRGEITDVRVVPGDVRTGERVTAALSTADQIVLGPGSLFTSVIAGLRVPGVAEAVNQAAGRLVYVCNLTTQDGETLGMSGSDHIEALTGIGGVRVPDAVVVHEGALQIPDGLTAVTYDDAPDTMDVLRSDVADPVADWPQHDPARLGAVLRRLA